ncbi:MAG: hypothetical protein KBS86_03280 [Proteobacteria bacterium]|nr:hypothetical protein [Candidatus Enterousia scatequi]
MQLINNPDITKMCVYKIARIIYAETYAKSLRVVEALASMIYNNLQTTQRTLDMLITDSNLFESLNKQSEHHWALSVDARNRGFQMCLRTVNRMLNGNLRDTCFGAMRFHRDEMLPDWAVARGYIADIDGLLFYL